MGKFQVSPILKLIENLTENVTPADVDMSFGNIMRITDMGKNLMNIGKGHISSDASPLGTKSSKIPEFS